MADVTIAPTPVVADPELDEDEPKEAHIVRKEDQMRGYVMGEPIVALCGKVWTPSRDYEGLPVCPRCKEIMEQLRAGMGGQN